MAVETFHGSLGGYTNERCRCQSCRDAHAAYQREWRAFHRDLLERGLGHPTHGLDSTYHNWGCRCEECTKAHSENGPEQLARKRYGVKLLLYRRAAMSFDGLYSPRPGWLPRYLDPECDYCNTKLVPVDSLSTGWLEETGGRILKMNNLTEEMWAWDEWICPSCKDRIRFDWPKEAMERMFKQARKHLSVNVIQGARDYPGEFVVATFGDIIATGPTPRAALRDAEITKIQGTHIIRVPQSDDVELVIAPIDVVAAYFRLEQSCPSCGNTLKEEFQELFLIRRECSKCDFVDLWRIGAHRKDTAK